MHYKPKLGEEFALSASVVEAKTRRITEVTRSVIALAMVITALVTVAIGAALCMYRDDFAALQTLWAVMAAPLGCIIGYYFRGSGTDGQKNHASSA
jgi:hypothetical protein